ncbi:MAG: adenylosuccinate lyase [Planctomycetes bacterium]|nr:adenylosuccinate lyase [Planctomycetota bacterium]
MSEELETYQSPLVERYASREMTALFSARRKFGTWRRLWVALAEAEAELGLDIRPDQIEALRRSVDDIDFDRARSFEAELRHDVMAHVHTWREQCPQAGGIIHLGATSCYVTDNTDALLLREGLEIVLRRLRAVIRNLRDFALAQAERPTVGYTHFQPAQFTTVGKRASLWLQDLVLDHEELEQALGSLRFRGVKGTTGTQDSFMKLFDGDEAKVEDLDRRVTEKMGFARRFMVTGQTYSRKMDSRVLSALAAVAQSTHKFSNDLRLLCHLREIEEPFESKQIGSSAMAYKRNPMRSERIGSLSRWLISMYENAAYTQATQWLERSLDDSANRRLSIPQAFLAADAILLIAANVTAGLVVRDAVIDRHLREHVPFIASEELMMKAAQKGGDRQELHEVIRRHAIAAAEKMKNEGGENDFLERLMGDAAFSLDRAEAEALLDPARFIGRAPSQVRAFVSTEVDPILARWPEESKGRVELRV